MGKIEEAALSAYEKKLSAVSNASGEAFKHLVEAQRKPGMSDKELKSVIYHAANDAINTFADASGKVSCNFFEDHIKDCKPTEIPPVPKYIKNRMYEHIEQYAKTHDLGDDEFMRLLAEDVGCEVYHHANRTTKHNAAKNSVRYARVPFGNSCAFCLMLSTRGFVYLSRTSAGEDKGHYHAHCHCKIVASKKGTTIDGYDPEGLDYRIHQVAQELGISDFSWQDYMRDPAMQAVLQKEIRLRDENWLLTGKVPEPTYASEKIKKSVTIDNPWENRTALRLAQHGYKPNFIVDFITVKGNGVKRRVGLPDFASGLEIKTLTTSKNAYGAVGNYLEKSQKKKGLKKLVIDNSESVLADEDVLKAIKKLKPNYKIKNIALLLKSGELISI